MFVNQSMDLRLKMMKAATDQTIFVIKMLGVENCFKLNFSMSFTMLEIEHGIKLQLINQLMYFKC